MTTAAMTTIAATLGNRIPVLLLWTTCAAVPAMGQSDTQSVSAELFADGSAGCGGADDLSNPAGDVTLRPIEHGIEFQVVLYGAAQDWTYYVELSLGGLCQQAGQFHGLTTDSSGNGWFKGTYRAVPGSHEVLVAVVSDPPDNVPPNPQHRELATSAPVPISVPGEVGSSLTLGFDGAPPGLPWSEQGFTFTSLQDATLQGEALELYSSGGLWPLSAAELTRDDGGSFDALSLEVHQVYFPNGGAWLHSDLGGYAQVLAPGRLPLTGPGWRGITSLRISASGGGDGGGLVAYALTDDFEVWVPTGERYCSSTPNSSGAAAMIRASGSSNLEANDLVLRAVGLPDELFLFFHAADRMQIPFGNGLRCAGGDVVRLPASVSADGVAETFVDLPTARITAPGRRQFQCWFRDSAAGGAGFDTSDGLSIQFVP